MTLTPQDEDAGLLSRPPRLRFEAQPLALPSLNRPGKQLGSKSPHLRIALCMAPSKLNT